MVIGPPSSWWMSTISLRASFGASGPVGKRYSVHDREPSADREKRLSNGWLSYFPDRWERNPPSGSPSLSKLPGSGGTDPAAGPVQVTPPSAVAKTRSAGPPAGSEKVAKPRDGDRNVRIGSLFIVPTSSVASTQARPSSCVAVIVDGGPSEAT